jgi:hypothetical protein
MFFALVVMAGILVLTMVLNSRRTPSRWERDGGGGSPWGYGGGDHGGGSGGDCAGDGGGDCAGDGGAGGGCDGGGGGGD